MAYLDIAKLETATVASEPFPFLTVPRFVREDAYDAVSADFPDIDTGGSFPPSALRFGPAFQAMVDELHTPQVMAAFERHFDIDLTNRPTTFTVRGWSRRKDGRIHTDSKTKLVTVLVYLNELTWEPTEGRLRLLNGGTNVDDFAAEVVPEWGMLAAFKCVDNAWHGFHPYVGRRRSLQLNWVVDEGAAKSVGRRHGLSAFIKKLTRRR